MHNLTDEELRDWQKQTDRSNTIKRITTKEMILDLLTKIEFDNIMCEVELSANDMNGVPKLVKITISRLLRSISEGEYIYSLPNDELKSKLQKLNNLENEVKNLRDHLYTR